MDCPSRKPHSVEDALKFALEYEAFQKGRCGRYGDVRPFSRLGQHLTSDINGGKSQTSGLVGNQNRGSNGNGKHNQCTFCQRLGHVEKDCYQKRSLQNAGNRNCNFCNSPKHLIRDCEARYRNLQNYTNYQGGIIGITSNQGNGNQNEFAQGGNQAGYGC